MGEVVEGRFSFGRFVMAAWLFFLVGAVPLVFGVAMLFAPANPEESILWRYAMCIPCVLLGVAVLGWCGVQYVGRTQRLEVRPDGMSWVKGGRTESAAWADVREVYRNDSYTVTGPNQQPSEWMRRAHVRVAFRNGTEVTFRQTLSNFDALAAAVQEYAALAMLPAAHEIAQQGEIEFGTVAVGSKGLRLDDKLLTWDAINYAVSGGWITVVPSHDDFKFEETKEVELCKLPNYILLLELMARLGKPPIPRLLAYPKEWREHMAKSGG